MVKKIAMLLTIVAKAPCLRCFHALRKKCPYSELFWSAFFSHFPTFGLNMALRIQS